jgi:hypothetical protein
MTRKESQILRSAQNDISSSDDKKSWDPRFRGDDKLAQNDMGNIRMTENYLSRYFSFKTERWCVQWPAIINNRA